jgi:multidrug resistance efflux pump
VGEEEWIQRRQAVAAAKEVLQQARDEDALLKKGAWDSDIAVAEAAVALAEQQEEKIRVEIDRMKVKAPIAGRVLQVNVRPGEYVGAPPGEPLVVLGNLESLRVRIDIDESDIPDFVPGMSARAFLRGETTDAIPLVFVRVEPYVIPKRSLTRAAQEQVDTRVLQVIYEVEKPTRTLYVGQLLDVFFDAEAETASGQGVVSRVKD